MRKALCVGIDSYKYVPNLHGCVANSIEMPNYSIIHSGTTIVLFH